MVGKAWRRIWIGFEEEYLLVWWFVVDGGFEVVLVGVGEELMGV